MSTTVTVHIISNAHLDPAWLWPWQAGLDEALATGNTMCDLLDECDDFIFTAGEAWRYQQIEQTDPTLFARISRHIKADRWALVGGWWIQPDCNFPGAIGFERQIGIGKQYFMSRFGRFPEVAYNVDSFGHAATLPGFMHAAGQKYYVMMRPQEHEMELPARFFRWQGVSSGPEIVTFRIAGSYNTGGDSLDINHVRRSLEAVPKGISHTMCFIGVGDHGGGPTARLLDAVRQNAEAIPGCRLVFSSPDRFFKAIAPKTASLPLVTGEMQMHAVGCYSVVRGIKTRVLKAEHRLRQAEIVGGAERAAGLEKAWQAVAFNQFHDILGGTCVPSAYEQQYHQLGGAIATADEILQHALRKRYLELPPDPLQRLILLNASDALYEGYVECEPKAGPACRLLDEAGQPVPAQLIQAEEVNGWHRRLLFRVRVEPGASRAIRLDAGSKQATASRIRVTADSVENDGGARVSLGAAGGMTFPGGPQLALPQLELLDDGTDNWSHNTDRYPEGPVTSPSWNAPCPLDSGPLMGATVQTGGISDSTLRAEWRVYAEELYIELRLTVNWRERRKLLKLTLPLPGTPRERRDGIPGASLVRPNSGRECPVRDWTMMGGSAAQLAVASPDVYALDATPHRLRLTLLRSPIMTHHDPSPGTAPRATIADQGEHQFLLRFYGGPTLNATFLDQQALMMHRPLIVGDLTRGMPRR